ncbi:hypothetical protein KP509_23G068000 [Ceratopteris richardii]|uniref:non-specific serine/threonine protein kinase n=1 Tax=Ceratopteris richardii TaxID=49495 RepID=A0A8T2S0S4_CERRI|nr:hypothetical protein KP509_23G068000 [Ceratopteris richardii]KAH7302338.1 hypothetical protein KP509_23G068000 [Ceratopteris richardii]
MMSSRFPAFFFIISFLSALCSSSEAQSDDQALALLSIKSEVGASSPNITSWNTAFNGGPCGDKWVGVVCDASGRITGLNMSGFYLKGKLPTDVFSSLTNLESIDFSNNELQSPFPSLNNLKNLHDLNFSNNLYKEGFPETLLSLTSLVELRFDENNLTGSIPEEISNLKLLEEMTVWGSDLNQKLPPEWSVWVNLTYLNLHDTNIHGDLPSEWGAKFTKLQQLSLYNNKLTGPIPDSWKGMTSLDQFRLKNNYLSGPVPSWISQLANASDVDFVCNYLTGTVPSVFVYKDTWQGNCFDSDSRSHDQKCTGDGTCKGGPPTEDSHDHFPTGGIIGIVIGLVILSCVILAFGYVLWRRPDYIQRRRCRRDKGADNWEVPQGVRRFTYKEILKATKSFDQSCEIGEGGFGKVYLAQLEDDKHVAIKRAGDMSHQGMKEFQNEITLLSRLHHRHLVRLEGFCDDRDEQILVYEYMSNGNLHRQLFDKHAINLNWYRRVEIALSVAKGLDYLHSFADPPVIHRDVKPSNILLDDHMIAKVSDFGISKANPEMDTHVSTRPAGTAGYLDPEYFLRRHLTTASDVYGYGVVLLELITGQLAIDHKRLEDYNLVGWVKPRLVKQGIDSIVDPRLGQNYPVDAYKELAEIAVGCTAFERGDRPTMQHVVNKLEILLASLVPPPENMAPVSLSPGTSLLKSQESSAQFSAGSGVDITNQSMGDLKIDLAFKGTTVEPR